MVVEHTYLNGRTELVESCTEIGETFYIKETRDGICRITLYYNAPARVIKTFFDTDTTVSEDVKKLRYALFGLRSLNVSINKTLG